MSHPNNIVLHEHQKNHMRQLHNILRKWGVAFDLSPTGLGKTYTACALSEHMNKALFVVAPSSVLSKWREVVAKYRLKYFELISYEKLRSKSDWLYTTDKDAFKATDKLKCVMASNALVIFDEAHKLKNNTITNRACQALAEAVFEPGMPQVGIPPSNSNLLLMSATLMDKPEHVYNMFRVTGLCRYTDEFVAMKAFCQAQMNTDDPNWGLIPEGRMNKAKFAFMFTNTFIKAVSSTMCAPENNFRNYTAFLYLNMEGEVLKKYVESVEDLLEVLNNPNNDGDRLAKLNKLLQEMQLCKVMGMVEHTKRILAQGNTKVVLFCDYHSVMDILMDMLSDYNPELINGSVHKSQRQAIYKSFQADSGDTRLLITSLSVSGQGIDLHDTTGNWARWVLMMPNFRALDVIQEGGRIFRNGSLSDANVRILFASSSENFEARVDQDLQDNPNALEGRVFMNIWQKGVFCKSVMADQANNGVQFICDYDDEAEEGAQVYFPSIRDAPVQQAQFEPPR